MSYRNIDTNVQQLLRTMQDQIAALQAGVGVNTQNTVHLGDWIVEAVGDHVLRLTNVKTGVVSYAGGPSELPVFSYYGHVEPSISPAYMVPYACTIVEVAVTLGGVPESAADSAPDEWVSGFPAFSLLVNGQDSYFRGTSEGVFDTNIVLASGDELSLQVKESKGYNLCVVPRLTKNGGALILNTDFVEPPPPIPV